MLTLTVPFDGPIDRAQLADEIEAACGVRPIGGQRSAGGVSVEFPDGPLDQEAVTAAVLAHRPAEDTALDAILAKSRRVYAGEATFTVAEIQRIVAGLVILAARRRE